MAGRIDVAIPPMAQHRLLALSRSAGYAVGMTKLLEIALTKAAKLPEAEQVRIARLVLDETLDAARWQATFAGSQDKLARLAERARGEIARGEIRRDDPSDLPE